MDTPPPLPQPAPSVTTGVGFGLRVLGRLVDSVFGLVLGIGAGVFSGVVLAILHLAGVIAPGWAGRVQGFNWGAVGLSLIGNMIYHALAEGIGGASVGKLICGVRVVDRGGGTCGIEQGFRRSLAFFWDGLFFGLIAYTSMEMSPLRQRYGDTWAETVVVKSAAVPEAARRPVWKVVVGVGLGALLWGGLVALGTIVRGL
jgi:uncharacterized RDD family membrane protein YckC